MTERTIAGRYQLTEKIGSGGMGTVWKAHDTLLDRTVAVKLLHEGLAEDAAFNERFRREARSAASLSHPNIVAVYDTGSDNVPFIVMEYVTGESLHHLLNRQGPLPVEDTARIAHSILAALGHAHARGLVHRDMKPANVLFDESTGEAKVVDFGIAKGLDDTGGLTKTSGLIGTAAYLSPEQVSGHDATPQSDLYATGCLLYACLAGEPPFSGSTPIAIAMRHLNDPIPPLRDRRPDVPPEFEAVILGALEKDPHRRFANAEQMDAAVTATGLTGLAATTPVVNESVIPATTVAMRDHPVGGAPVGTEVYQRERTSSGGGGRWLPAVAAFLVVAAIAAVVALYLNSREPGLTQAPLPSTSVQPSLAPQTAAPTPKPTVTPQETEATETERPCASLPGLNLPCPETPAPTEPPTPSPSGTPAPTL